MFWREVLNRPEEWTFKQGKSGGQKNVLETITVAR